MEEAVAKMEELIDDDDVVDATIYIQPPVDNGVESEQDSDNEDQPRSLDHLSARQLAAGAELRVRTRSTPAEDCDTDTDSEPVAVPVEPTKKAKIPPPPERKWEDVVFSPSIQNDNLPLPNRHYSMTRPIEYFELFFDDVVLEYICECSIKYAQQKGNHNFNLDKGTLKSFLGILILSGYCDLPRCKMYWEQKPDVHNQAVSDAMSRNRFDDIMQYLHVCDNNNLPPNDKFGKVRHFLSMLNERWLHHFPGDTNICVDESMVPYYGRHGAKQHIHGKPIRFGYKVWCLANKLGYLIQCEPYQGASTGNTNPALGVGGSVVCDLISELNPDTKHNIFMDNFFTSLKLLNHLSSLGYGATGTIRCNRIENAPIEDPKVVKKSNRGYSCSIVDNVTNIMLCSWHDNSVVTMATNCHTIEPKAKAKRWSAKDKKSIEVHQPNLIAQYNAFMGGVDQMDQNISNYRISMRKRRWWWPIFSWLLSACLNNSWQLSRLHGGDSSEDQLSFIRSIVLPYLAASKAARVNLPLSQARASVGGKNKAPVEVRTDGAGHFLEAIPKQRRCAQCHKKVQKLCTKCDVPLHLECFQLFHA